ncbi:Glucose-6-phosphate 1-dehydrogenase [Hondaea fermentalgiana]|uniref:Glucose-6-phosphate 1-dehydrogenase n=1 Tax=Hondaea fermentalgiana TaxID=2315210 RepID=A0A2R5GJ13_9STRA|nr:Glucose-6-phosphate 1-dehydrogenase [Hondaea fermentalgiana]|eukprot:GBG28281.1 Glucose-6-phosphate 1-dehydrogenase [Hondaea fermentalgiana]
MTSGAKRKASASAASMSTTAAMRLALLGLLVVSLLLQTTAAGRVNVVLLGATGNLAEKYLWQGLYNIHEAGLKTGDEMFVYAAATKDASKSSPILQRILANNITASSPESKAAFLARVSSYVQLRSEEQYAALGERMLEDMRASGETEAGRLLYLSVPPKFFGPIADNINKHLRPQGKNAWLRVIVEKPFGVDTSSAESLAASLYESLDKDEILLVDHYMGKSGLHGIRDFVKANSLPDFVGKNRRVSRVEIGMLETEDCKGRTGFYEEVGVLRDTMQNHLMMMLALLGMDADTSVAGAAEADARKLVFEQLSAASLDRVARIAQYASYHDHVNEDRAKWDEPLLEERSMTPTYAHVVLKLQGANDVLDNVPIHFKSGKALSTRRAYTELHFDDGEVLIFNLQGPAGASGAKGALVAASSALPSFQAPSDWEVKDIEGFGRVAMAPDGPFAYEVLLRAGLEGVREHFVRLDEVLESWRVWTPLLEEIEAGKVAHRLEAYKHGAEIFASDSKDEKEIPRDEL